LSPLMARLPTYPGFPVPSMIVPLTISISNLFLAHPVRIIINEIMAILIMGYGINYSS
jgi:hypothetical protein